MTDVSRTETRVRASERLPLLENPTSVVDSMSPPRTAEYISAHHALAQDCATLRLIENDMKECQLRIARAHAQIRFLERRRDAVQQRVSIYRARLSPLRIVPDQVLQEVFQYCLPDAPYVVPSARSAPLVLTHVCRRWRAVAHGTSELWSSMTLHDHSVWNSELELEMMKRWLGRSHMRPISMRLACPPRTDFRPNGNPSCARVFQLAVAHSPHIRDLRLDVSRTYLHHFLHSARLPALRSIAISLHSAQRTDEPPELPVPAFISARRLRRIALKGNVASTKLIPDALCPQITHLSLDCNLTLDLALLFQDFVRLEHLVLALTPSLDALRFQLPPPGEHHHRVVGPSLRCLEIRLDRDTVTFGDPATLDALLDHLALPALQTLFIVVPAPYRECQTDRAEDAAWGSSPSVDALLSLSRHARPRVERRVLDCVPGRQGPYEYEEFEKWG